MTNCSTSPTDHRLPGNVTSISTMSHPRRAVADSAVRRSVALPRREPKRRRGQTRTASAHSARTLRWRECASLSQLLTDALADCDNLKLQYNEVGEMRPLTEVGSRRFKSENMIATLRDPDD